MTSGGLRARITTLVHGFYSNASRGTLCALSSLVPIQAMYLYSAIRQVGEISERLLASCRGRPNVRKPESRASPNYGFDLLKLAVLWSCPTSRDCTFDITSGEGDATVSETPRLFSGPEYTPHSGSLLAIPLNRAFVRNVEIFAFGLPGLGSRKHP